MFTSPMATETETHDDPDGLAISVDEDGAGQEDPEEDCEKEQPRKKVLHILLAHG